MAFTKSLRRIDAGPDGQAGFALPVVLGVLAALLALAALTLQRNRLDRAPWLRVRDKIQAQYLAESGIAWALYQERFGRTESKPKADSLEFSSRIDVDTAENLFFTLDTGLYLPEVDVDRDKAFLEIHARGYQGRDTVKINASFGRLLDPELFQAALTWENDTLVQPFPSGQIKGSVRLKMPLPGMASEPWPGNLSTQNYAESFVSDLFYSADAELREALAKPGSESGNGYFEPWNHPDFPAHEGAYRYPLGQIEIAGGAFDTLIVQGPGAFFSHGDIRVRGKVKLDGILLASEGNIVFEGEVHGKNNRLYAKKNISLMGRSRVEIQAQAGGNIFLRDEAEAVGQSLLMIQSQGKPDTGKNTQADAVQAIRIVNSAKVQGFVLALGPQSRVVMAGAENRIQGVVLANEAWLAGEIWGSVAVKTLRCGEKMPRQCLGPAVIDRSALPTGFLQPMRMGPMDAKHLQFKVLSYEFE